jgi:hypothetical protein
MLRRTLQNLQQPTVQVAHIQANGCMTGSSGHDGSCAYPPVLLSASSSKRLASAAEIPAQQANAEDDANQ